jgi:hypothetical protein
MRMRKTIAGALLLVACGSSPSTPDAGSIDTMGPSIWTPAPGDAKNWDIQLHAPIDTSTQRTMYVLDLFAVVPAPVLLYYNDGNPLTVPAGSQAGAIAALHATTPPTMVICAIETGALELTRPDAGKFPGNEHALTTCPPAAPSGAIGKALTAPDECALDITAAGVDAWKAVMFKRFDLAKAIGCDGILGDRNDIAAYDTGFTITADDQLAWYQTVATETRVRGLSAGMKDAEEIPGFTDQLAPDFDWFVIQRCAEYQDCDAARPFINLHKDVFAIDYQIDNTDPQNPTGIDPAIACPRQQTAQISDGLVKDEKLSSAYRYQCTP